MKVQLKNRLFYVHWSHNNHVGETTAKLGIRNPIKKIEKIPSWTECIIKDASTGEVERQGRAFLGKKEKNYNKSVGRKVALKEAISFLSKEERKIFWEAYFKETNQKFRK